MRFIVFGVLITSFRRAILPILACKIDCKQRVTSRERCAMDETDNEIGQS